MQLNATIAAEDVNDLLLSLNGMIPVAQRAAIQSAINAANEAVINTLATENDLPITVVSHRVMTDISADVGKIWIGTLPVNTEYLQPFEESGSGAYAGPFFFDGAFVVERGGRTQMFRRESKHKYPIEYLMTKPLQADTNKIDSVAGNTYLQVFIDKLDETL